MSERSGVEIDYCPQCRGVWLDRGELDKVIERGNAQLAAAGARPDDRGHADDGDRRERERDVRDRDRDRDRDRKGDDHKPKKKKKKSSFLTDIFESLGE